MGKDKDIFKQIQIFFLLLVLSSVFLITSNLFHFRKDFMYILINPINSVAFSSGESIRGFLGVFGEMKELRKDFYSLQQDYLVVKGENKSYVLLKEENILLKEQLGLEKKDEKLILAQILHQDMDLRTDNLILNQGEDAGIEKNDIVVMGDIYLGLVTEVASGTSKVRLPTSRASSLKVMILREGESVQDLNVFLNGIALGHSNLVKVENIEMLGEFQEGDPVFINDPKIGEYLYLGSVQAIDDDPTETSRSCGIKLPVDYQTLKYVFVKRI